MVDGQGSLDGMRAQERRRAVLPSDRFPSGPLSDEPYYSHQIKAADFGILSAPSLGVYFQLMKSRFWVDVSLQNVLGISRLISAYQGLLKCFASI